MDRELVRMFWNKKPSPVEPDSNLQTMAHKLGVERRRSPRVRYPQSVTAGLPGVYLDDQGLRVSDVSVGGCCVLDPREILGCSIGVEVTLELRWPDKRTSVRSRIVGRVDHRRHIQFLDLSAELQKKLSAGMSSGIRGTALRRGLKSETGGGPTLQAREIWNSLNGDTLTLEEGMHRLAEAVIEGHRYVFFKDAWPVDSSQTPVPIERLNEIILFLTNIVLRGPAVEALLADLEKLAAEAGA